MDVDRLARIALSRRTEPGDPVVGGLLAQQPAHRLVTDRPALLEAAQCLQRWRAQGIGVLVPGDAGWPTQVADLPVPPIVLYTAGAPLRPALLRSVAIVGARRATDDGSSMAADWASQLAAAGYGVVSGAAFGIDAAAHRGALRAGGATVAVLASGVDVPSPRSHAQLLQQIGQRGTIVSELPPGTVPARHRFLTRNRLIAALTPGTLVVQAASRSGALATARAAAGLNRVVMAVPGRVRDDAHHGCHDLIRDHIAVLVTGPGQVRELLEPLGSLDGDATARPAYG